LTVLLKWGLDKLKIYNMNFPSHIIMEINFKKTKQVIPYWTFKYINTKQLNPFFLNDTYPSNLTLDTKKTCEWETFIKSSTTITATQTNKLLINKLLNNLYSTLNIHNSCKENVSLYPVNKLININFLRYERLYTKLKYSRSPAFDTVSGGGAAIFAGFLGFLISEKFGFELVDSGDFYYLFMYAVFFAFILKPLLYMSHVETNIISSLLPKNLISFFTKIILLLLCKLKNK